MKTRWKFLIILGFILDTILFTGFVGLDWYYDDVTLDLADRMAYAHDQIWTQFSWIKESMH